MCVIILLQCTEMMDDSETAEDTEKSSVAEVTDDSCKVEFIEIVPLDRASDDYHKLEFIEPVVEVKPEDLLDLKGKPQFIDRVVEVKPDFFLDVKQEPADEYDNEDLNNSVKQESTDEYETDEACFIMQVICACTNLTTFNRGGHLKFLYVQV